MSLYEISRKYLRGFHSYERMQFVYQNIGKRHNSVKSAYLWYLFCANCLIISYICINFCKSISQGFKVTDLNSGVDARVVANVDGQTDGCSNGRMDGKPDP